MKKICIAVIAIVVVCIMSVMPVCAYANSAQREFTGVTASGAIVTTENCPITVSAERLTFNIVDYPDLTGNMQSYLSNVTAEYDFYNPAYYDVTMQLVFPFGKLPDYVYEDEFNDTDKYGISVNGEAVESVVRATYAPYGFDLTTDLPKISDKPVFFKNYADDTIVYKYSVKNEFEKVGGDVTYVADFAQDDRLYFISRNGFSQETAEDKSTYLRVYGEEEFDLYSVGQPLDDEFFSANYYALNRGGFFGEEKAISGSSKFSLSTLTLEEVLTSYYNEDGAVSRLDYRNAVAAYFNGLSKPNVFYLGRFDLYSDLMYWYQYDINVAAGQTVTNKVVAPLYPDIEMRYSPTVFRYEYLLSPAKSWAGFANLDITVKTSKYMLNPSLEGFNKTDEGYSAHFDTLPQGELNFDLCESETPERNNDGNVLGVVLTAIIIIAVVVVLVIVAGIVCAIVIPIAVSKKRSKTENKLTEADKTCSSEQKDAAMNDYFDKNK